ncbi:MAG: hypothetical protein ABIJ16_09125 [Bacteroidota bacterium]
MILKYSAVNRPLIIIRNKEMIEIKGDRLIVGNSLMTMMKFKKHKIQFKK